MRHSEHPIAPPRRKVRVGRDRVSVNRCLLSDHGSETVAAQRQEGRSGPARATPLAIAGFALFKGSLGTPSTQSSQAFTCPNPNYASKSCRRRQAPPRTTNGACSLMQGTGGLLAHIQLQHHTDVPAPALHAASLGIQAVTGERPRLVKVAAPSPACKPHGYQSKPRA